MDQYQEYGYTALTPNHAHRYILPILLNMLDPEQNRCILDMGCGNGSLARALLERGYDVYGVDASTQGVVLANSVHPGRFFVQHVDDPQLPAALRDKPFDTIISTEVIEHLYAPRIFLNRCNAILARNPGRKFLLLSTPYHGYLKNLALSLAGAMDAHFTALWDGGHIKFWSRRTLSLILAECGFTVTEFQGAGRLPYLWKSMVLKAELK